jgi:hypothetical protein
MRLLGALLTFSLAVSAGAALAADAATPADNCGMSPSDWCASPPNDPCGAHMDTASCTADPACFGMPYRGESVVACIFDERGFASNCPTVGCTSTPPAKAGEATPQ